MAFWKKKTREVEREEKIEDMNYELPELPKLPDISQLKLTDEISSEKKEEGGLPELPEIYKEAVKNNVEIPVESEKKLTAEIPVTKSFDLEEEKIEEIGEVKKIKGPIYVKVDKFKDALENFGEVKQKIKEIEMLLKKIKEIRVKEQEELDMWGKELEEIKSKIVSIDEKLFSKIEY